MFSSEISARSSAPAMRPSFMMITRSDIDTISGMSEDTINMHLSCLRRLIMIW